MADQFDVNWSKFAKIVNGKCYTKTNKRTLDYESHFVEFSLNIFLIQIEVFIQLEPAKRSYSTFLERYTIVRLKSTQKILQKFELSHKGFLSRLFLGKDKSMTGSKQFDSKYQIKAVPKSLVCNLFDHNALIFFAKRKIIEGNLHTEIGKENIIEMKFPEILYTTEDIESI